MMQVAVLQSNYLPWKGYFDIIHRADVCVIYDDVQFTKNDWRNRNRIMTPNGPQWLTVPVGDAINRLICDVRIEQHHWQLKHWKSIEQAYRKMDWFSRYESGLRDILLGVTWSKLSELNYALIQYIVDAFGIRTKFRDSREFVLHGKKGERLLDLLMQLGATNYVSGPSAEGYLDLSAFGKAGIEVEFMRYRYPEYPQGCGPFVHEVSAIDLLFAVGPDAGKYIW